VLAPGAVVVWSGDKPRLDVHRIPEVGLVFGRDHTGDDRMSVQHLRISVAGAHFAIEDLGSRNGTFLDGQPLVTAADRPTLPAIVRTGRTVLVLLADVRAYEGATITRRGALVCAGSLATACAAVDHAARAEDHIALIGPLAVGRGLAHSYADTVGGERVIANLDAIRLSTLADKLAGATPRTLILELSRPLTLPDLPELEAWLETDVRIVTVARGMEAFDFMPTRITARLCARKAVLPQYRFDELPSMIADRATVHASFIAAVLVGLRMLNEDTLMRLVDDTLHERAREDIRDIHFNEMLARSAGVDCVVGNLPRRR
jgi:hypothetical protein